eukprot:COSAG04_NODE_30426_length_262_cov_11.674847_1_plen_59_part_10
MHFVGRAESRLQIDQCSEAGWSERVDSLPFCLKKSLKKLVQAARSNFTSPKQCQASCDA